MTSQSTTNYYHTDHAQYHSFSNEVGVSSALPPKMQQKKRHNTTASTSSSSSSSSNEHTTILEIASGEALSSTTNGITPATPIPVRQYQQPTIQPILTMNSNTIQPHQQQQQHGYFMNGSTQSSFDNTQMQSHQGHVMIMMDDDKGEAKKRKRRNQAKSACEQCRRAHTACTDQKPCLRCVKLGLQCVEAPKKKQKPNGKSSSGNNSPPPTNVNNTYSTDTSPYGSDLSSLATRIQNIPNMNPIASEQHQHESVMNSAGKSSSSSSSSDGDYSSGTTNSPTQQTTSYPPQVPTIQTPQPSFAINRLTPLSVSQFQTLIKEGNVEKVHQVCEISYQLITMSVDEIKTIYPVLVPAGQEQLTFNTNRNGFLLAYLYGKFNIMNAMRDILWKQYRSEYFSFLFKLISFDDDKALIRMYLQGIQYDLNTVENEKSIGLLSFCACCGRIEIFKLLCEEFQCSLFQVRNEKYLPIHFACSYSNVEIAEYILQKYPIQLDIQVNNNSSPLLVSAAYGSLKSIKFLIDRGANVNLCDIDGLYAIHYAVKYNHFAVVQYLAQHNADFSVKNNSGQTIFDFATDSDKKFMLELIVQNKNLNDRILLQEDIIKNMKPTSCK
ncbi:ankyrin domain-containing protein [Naegleria gruberi]|uniref:Ankyrin domain-containing protein n=1 Tax=Naegleria gruberi TaxID=5762 RepID=D2VML5_NAEGR|nr:ankyrin domain-containing protein [Naegleria gruberi]EFC42005.1 ankyrin domain-containing protein [Naegleria gruberi]|eukprot:XP_002674749.1 ankyrin domain-containing protein [Naegleria gruberi strain NEG-M]